MQIYKIDNIEYKQYIAILDIIDNVEIDEELLTAIKKTQLYKKIVYTFLVEREDQISADLQEVVKQFTYKIIDAIYPDDLYDKAQLIVDTEKASPEEINQAKVDIIDLSPDFIIIDDKGEQLNPIDVLSKL